jgi:tRNA(Arg) A34 adenosine deaminase TadA
MRRRPDSLGMWTCCTLDRQERWEQIDCPWQAAFELACQALQQGSPPIGAVVVGEDRSVVSAGRSRRFEADAPRPDQLFNTNLAHAEMNALIGLPPGDYPHHVLYP